MAKNTDPTLKPLQNLFNLIYDDTSKTIAVATSETNITTIAQGRKTVANAGVAEALAASTPCVAVIITAETDNTGIISVGGTGVIAALSTRTGTPLAAGDSVILEIANLASIFIDSTVSTDGVTYTYFN